ncbi:hypothetical protein [Sodalis sp. RH18]|uniref:hypothetical protein n=1 Tax=Sodalis sp. RH18 TaxID=3394333 RepID=UPI0039B4AD17
MTFKYTTTKNVQLLYKNESYLCNKDIELTVTCSISNIFKDSAGNFIARLIGTVDGENEIVWGEYPFAFDLSSSKSSVEQAEEQILALDEFLGFEIVNS